MTHRFDYLVTGCGHSGTGTMSLALTSLGIPCTHEGVRNGRFDRAFGVPGNPPINHVRAESNHYMLRPGGIEMPFFERATIIHLTRHPILVIRSWLCKNYVKSPTCGAYRWVQTNRRVERAMESHPYVRFAIEEGPERLAELLGKPGAEVSFPMQYNRHWDGKYPFSWDLLPLNRDVDELMALAVEYGYSLEDTSFLGNRVATGSESGQNRVAT